jgi:N-acetylglucosaminyl-diphospho-decaprenol L-rhamnosyltransferase
MTPMAVAIVNANTCEHLRACLATVRAEAPAEVVVVDNASADGSVAMVQADYPEVRLLTNATNLGYGAGANQALAACAAPYVLLLNSDTRLAPGALAALRLHLERHPRAAIVGPRLVNPDGSLQASCYPFPTPLHTFLENSDAAVRVGRLVRGYFPVLRDSYLRTWSHTSARVVPWVKGAALAIRRTAFDAVGGFDPAFFMYSEDTDLCYRLALAGWEVHFAPVTTVVHVGGASTIQLRTDMAVQFLTSTLRFYERHSSRKQMTGVVAIVKGLMLTRLARDGLRLGITRDPARRTELAANIAAWRHVLLGRWRHDIGSEQPMPRVPSEMRG